ncbi:MAG: hypothetical protein ACI8P3_003991 [Saprospiraceae bacterium]|jgi:hypothetical protein
MKKVLLLFCPLLLISCMPKTTEKEDKEIILSIMKAQQQAWSDYDIAAFMDGYWKSDSLKFYGAGGITYGWEQTLANYHKRYPSKEHTGTLNFKIIDLSKIDTNSYYVMGEYHLVRTVGNADGIFMIIFKKINGEWKIIADTSC